MPPRAEARPDPYDVVVVGGRVAGASTALLLARAGHRVLVLDREPPGRDTLSTHALMRPGVLQLERWGVLDDVIAAGTPGQDRVVFRYDDEPVVIDVSRTLYAPRRTVLDPILLAAAQAAGAEFRAGVDVIDVVRDRGRICGVRVRSRGRAEEEVVRARWVVGADGRRSRIAAAVDAPVTRQSAVTSAAVYGYWEGVETDGYEWCYAPGLTAGIVPTDGDQACVFLGPPPDRFVPELRRRDRFVAAIGEVSPDAARRLATARLVGPLRGFAGLPGWMRRPWGPGWALVGDAGYFKDPSTAHGISDALRDAELLAGALDAVLAAGQDACESLGGYERTRDALSLEFWEITERVASFDWTLDELRADHLRMSRVMQQEVAAMERWQLPGHARAA